MWLSNGVVRYLRVSQLLWQIVELGEETHRRRQAANTGEKCGGRRSERHQRMKLVTYNVNGLRQRVSQFGSLLKLLDSFDADIICFQETKLRRQELTTDLTMADGYESFFACTRSSEKGRTGYSGVATFCRVKSAFFSSEAALPVAAEEGFTGLINGKLRGGRNETLTVAEGLEEFEKDELLQVDGEGRCVITDHGHFVVFNIYGPRAEADDAERVQFKHKFFNILERRWECLLHQGRRVFVVGDLNIAPFAIDRCDAGPDFAKNEFRKWFRSLLVESGGPFLDVFRARHPKRRDAYTCWPSSTGAEQFNYGSRIDHILVAGSCLHDDQEKQGHNFVTCHVKECDILTQYKRLKDGSTPKRWKGGWGLKLEGSDHVPVYTIFDEIPCIPQHSTPSLASRYLPMVYGLQQTLVSVLAKRQATREVKAIDNACSSSNETVEVAGCRDITKRPLRNCCGSGTCPDGYCSSYHKESNCGIIGADKEFGGSTGTNSTGDRVCLSMESEYNSGNGNRKKARKSQSSQLSLTSFFSRCSKVTDEACKYLPDVAPKSDVGSQAKAKNLLDSEQSSYPDEQCPSTQEQDKQDINSSSVKQKNSAALLEWQRIRNLMQKSVPICKGHKEPCVSRVVKKPGPTYGRRFYVCARAEGPSSNPEANCGYFKWASSKFR